MFSNILSILNINCLEEKEKREREKEIAP